MKYVFFIILAMLLVCGAFVAYTYFFPTHQIISLEENIKLIREDNQSKKDSVTILAVGDIMLGRNVELLMNKNGDEFPFKNISGLLFSADTVLANLEGPVVEDHKITPPGSLHFTFDKRMPALLAAHNVGIVSLANNHTYDQGVAGYNETRNFVKLANIAPIGHPFAFSDGYLVRKTIKNQSFIFVGFNITNPAFNFEEAQNFVKNLQKNKSDILIAVIHGGTEYELHSNKTQENFYRNLIDVGVETVIAHHPHVVEEIEKYHDKFIFYSLGNFIFDQYFSQDVQDELAVKIHVNSNTENSTRKISYELIPVVSVHSQPEVMNDQQKATFLEKLALRSSPDIQKLILDGVLESR